MPDKTYTTSLRVVRPPPNRTNDDDVTFAFNQIKESQKAELDALTVTAKRPTRTPSMQLSLSPQPR